MQELKQPINVCSLASADALMLNKLGEKAKETNSARNRARRDLLLIAFVVSIACLAVLLDPDSFFEWLAQHKEVQVNEFLVSIVIVGTGFGVFSWRRWTDLSRQVAEYKRLQTELSEVNREGSQLSETDDLLQSCLASQEAFDIIIRHMKAQLPTSSGAICAITQTRDMVEVVARWGEPVLAETLFELKDCWGLRRGRVNKMLAGNSPLYCAHIGKATPSCAMCVPMMAQGETLGVLYLDSGKSGAEQSQGLFKKLSESEERMVKTLAEHLALAVANLNLRETLRTQSIRDPLTSLFNRRYMEESLERELRRAIRKKLPLAVVMVDVDHFKRFNDSFGHEAGDEVLRELARLLQSRLRAEDIACRYGGEEFVLILPEASLEVARERAELFCQTARESQVQFRGRALERISISVGLSCSSQHETTGEALLRAADAALYRAKDEGRDRIVIA
jgi:diguanylate cyclase